MRTNGFDEPTDGPEKERKADDQGCGRAAWYAVSSCLLLLSLTGWLGQCLYHTEVAIDGNRISETASGGLYYWKQGQYSDDRTLCEAIATGGYRLVGLDCSGDEYEFPLWVMLDGTEARIIHVNVDNNSGIYESEEETPECILSKTSTGEDELVYHGVVYSAELITDSGILYVAEYS